MSRPALETLYPAAYREKQLLEDLLKKIGAEPGHMSISRMQQVTGQMKRVLSSVQTLQSVLEEHKKTASGSAASVAVWESRVKRMVTECRLLMSEARQLIADQQGKTNYLTTTTHQDEGASRGRNEADDSELVKQSTSLDESLTMINQALQSGRESVYRLRQQNMTLKNANRKVRNALQSAGLSQAVIMTIERRIGFDRIIVALGMFISALTLYIFFCYWKTMSPFWFIPAIFRT